MALADATARPATRTRLGVEAENMGRPALDPGIIEMARACEACGVDSISVSDHLVSFASPARDGHVRRRRNVAGSDGLPGGDLRRHRTGTSSWRASSSCRSATCSN